jgi:hypothetical protein
MTTATSDVGRPCEVSLAPPYPELFASYGASAVTRTSGRGHVAEAKTNVIEAGRVCVYYCRTFYKAVRVGEEESGGHVL